jgi:tetratricopeptide (TPR) repeat protein
MLSQTIPSAATAAITAFRRGDVALARELVEQQLAGVPSSPDLIHLMGLIECRLGKFADGIRWLRRAADLDKANPAYRVVLARALIDSGRPAEALGITATDEGLPPELWQVRAEAAFAAGDRRIEGEAWAKLCEWRPREHLLWMNLARSLLAQSRFDEAEAAYYHVLSIAPRHIAAFHELGLTLERTNKIDELSTLLDQALQLEISKETLAETWALLELRRRRADEARLLLRSLPPGADPVRWNRLRVRAFDATGEPQAAFEAATAMNRAVSQYANARTAGAQYRAQLSKLAAAITPDWAASLPRL